MKYLLIAAGCLLGIVALSVRDADLTEFTEMKLNVASAAADVEKKSETKTNPDWNKYWYAGHAEISGYDLKQSRYGEIHEGQATMIFVTEPFSRRKQVKLDNASAAGSDSQAIIKLNSTRKFLTGIYPYSMMTSVFNPVNTDAYENAVKLNVSGQEWCGQVYLQMNQRGSKYEIESYSYFESEGDEDFSISKTYLEDEIYNLIRLNPELLPKGEVEMIPSTVTSRFIHEEVKAYMVMATSGSGQWQGEEVSLYTLKYAHNGREVKIYYQTAFPHLIEGWEDTYKGFGRNALTSTAVRRNTKMLDYWNKHNNKDRHLNKELYD